VKVLAAALELAALGLQVAGVLLMANGYTRVVATRDLPFLLLSALFRGKIARGAAQIGDLVAEDRLRALQGLALVGLGFMLQGGAVFLALLP